MAKITLSPIVKQIDKAAKELKKAQARTSNAVAKRTLSAKIKKLRQAERLVVQTCRNAGLNVAVPEK